MDIVDVIDMAGGLVALAMALGPLAVLATLIWQHRLEWSNRPFPAGQAR
jgi:hypothetical protein